MNPWERRAGFHKWLTWYAKKSVKSEMKLIFWTESSCNWSVISIRTLHLIDIIYNSVYYLYGNSTPCLLNICLHNTKLAFWTFVCKCVCVYPYRRLSLKVKKKQKTSRSRWCAGNHRGLMLKLQKKQKTSTTTSWSGPPRVFK